MAFQDEAMRARSKLHLGKVRPAAAVGAVAVAVMVAACAALAAAEAFSTEGFAVEKAAVQEAEASASGAEEAAAPAQVCVHVSGAVAQPGVRFLDEGSRVADAVVAAGGFTDDAAVDALNLARVLNDGEQVAVPTMEAQAAGASGSAAAARTGAASSATAAGGLVNINTADAAALQTLDGVGEATAKKIIADREKNGPFRSIDDLKRVSGIGDKKFENLRDSICA